MTDRTPEAPDGVELLAAGEAALESGDNQGGLAFLKRAGEAGVQAELLQRLARAFVMAARSEGRQAEVFAWMDGAIGQAGGPARLAMLHWMRVIVCRHLDLGRVELLVDDALAAAEAAGDEEACAGVLSSAAFAAYRRGDARAASKYADQARARQFREPAAHYEVLRAQLFAATVLGETEQVLNLSTKARAVARELGRPAEVAIESNNLAECYLDLGYPAEARACAGQAVELSRSSGDRNVELYAQVLEAVATAEVGQIDAALERFGELELRDHILGIDASAAYSYWLLERGAAGDADMARQVAEAGLARAQSKGVSNRLTPLYSNVARSHARQGQVQAAQEALEKARLAADRAELRAQLLLALAVAEVLPVSDPKRKIVLNHARARILRTAERREDPRAYCTEVRLNRRLLELSGGVPGDLPQA